MTQPLSTSTAARILALGLALGALAAPAGAQQQVSAKELQKAGFFSDFDELDLGALLEADVVEVRVASGFAVPLSEAPGAVTLFDDEAIRNSGARTLRELLATVPGFDAILGALGQDQIVVRGLRDRTFASSSGLLILYNDVPLNEPIYGGATAVNLDIPLDNVGRVEVLRGPAAALYGPRALSAVVSIHTRAFGELRGLRLSAGLGSFEHKTGALEMGSRIKGVDVAGFLLYDDFETTGLVVERDAQTVRDENDNTLFSKAPGELADDRKNFTTFYQLGRNGFTLDWLVTQQEGGGRFGEIQSLSVQNRLTHRQMVLSPAWAGTFGGGDAKVRASWVQSRFGELAELYPPGYELIQPDGKIVLPSGILFQSSLQTHVFGVEATWSRAVAAHRFLVGAAWRDERTSDLEANANVDYRDLSLIYEELTPLPGVTAEISRRTASAWGHALLQPHSALRLHAGARVDDVEDLEETLVSPRLAAVVVLPKGVTLFGAWARGHRLPGFAETSFELPGLFGGGALEAERNDQLEGGLRFTVKGLAVEAVAFSNKVEGTLGPARTPYDVQQPTFVRAGVDYEAQGFEFDARGAVGKHTVFANVTLQTVETGSGVAVEDVPELIATAGAALRFGRFVISPTIVHQGARPRAAGDSRADTESRTVARLNLQTRELFRRWDFSALVSNLFDEEYFDPSPVGGVPAGYPRLGRAFQVHAIFRF
ncbi:MAG: TonB-dependent receptor [Vicinamibacteria bacterium]|nr:TonB-dependent receptor [Vicinamibacteria bacterium]